MARPSPTPCRVCYSRCVSNKSLTSGKTPVGILCHWGRSHITLDGSHYRDPRRPCPRLGSMPVPAPRARYEVRACLRRVFTAATPATATSTPGDAHDRKRNGPAEPDSRASRRGGTKRGRRPRRGGSARAAETRGGEAVAGQRQQKAETQPATRSKEREGNGRKGDKRRRGAWPHRTEHQEPDAARGAASEIPRKTGATGAPKGHAYNPAHAGANRGAV